MLAACAPQENQVRGFMGMAPAVEEREVAPAPAAVEGAIAGTDAAWYPDVRMIVWTGDISLVVKDTEESVEEIESVAKGLGGYVADSSSWYQAEVMRARLTIRVPAGQFDAAMDRLKELSIKVERRNVSTQDVTEEYTDLDSRLRNLEATETELLELLTDVRQRTGKAEDVLAVHRELSNIRGQIEQAKGRMQYLSKMAAMATINIELIPDVLARPIVVAGWRPSGTVANALRSLVRTLQWVADAAIWTVFYLLPVLLVAAIPFLVLRLAWRRWKRRGEKAAPEGRDSTPSEDGS
jgi:tellurite resistance protein